MSAYWINLDNDNDSSQEKKENQISGKKRIVTKRKEKCTMSSDDIKNKLEAASKRREVCNIVFHHQLSNGHEQ